MDVVAVLSVNSLGAVGRYTNPMIVEGPKFTE